MDEVLVFPSMFRYELEINPALGNVYFDEIEDEVQVEHDEED